MNSDKKIIIDDLMGKVNASPFLLVIDYTAITVPEFTVLREELSAAGAKCIVAKNTFMVKALEEAGLPDISEKLTGQAAYVMGDSDVCGAAKAINAFAKKSKKAAYKAGILDGAEITVETMTALGNLPAREILLGQLLGTINAAGSALARVINAMVEKEGGAPADEAAPEETAAPEAAAE